MFAMPSPRPMDGEWTANTDHQTRNSIAVLGVSELIQYLRLPPRAPYETAERLSLFCQLSLDRKAETPWIPCVFRNPGVFCTCWGIVAYLQVLRPIYGCLGGERAAAYVCSTKS